MNNIEKDLGIGLPFIKGQAVPVANCWHFYTDGNALDALFYDETDFRNGMNRIFILSREYNIIILAFVLMDTHIHFVLYGDFITCNKFIHEYLRRTSLYISYRHGERNKLRGIPVSHQSITDDLYLKTVICYTLKNPTSGGIPCLPQDYPWSSAPLYFRSGKKNYPVEWPKEDVRAIIRHNIQKELHTQKLRNTGAILDNQMVFPGEYVSVDTVEKLFRTHRSYFYFMGFSKDEEVESRGGNLSFLSLPIQELRQHKREVCQELFGVNNLKKLDTTKRIKLAKALRSRFNCSAKQVTRVCGLIYEEVKTII